MNSRKATLFALVFCTWTLAFAPASHAAEDFKGNWTIQPSDETGKVRFGLIHRRNGGNSQHEADWPSSVFQGVDLAARGKRDVQFNITRDAGRFDCEGFLNDSEGAGIFRFTPDGKFAQAMDAVGFSGIDEEKQFAMAIHDVTVDFARQMKAQKLSGTDTDKLIAFRIFNVTPQFIQEMRAEGLTATDSDKLVAFRIHGVTPEFITNLKSRGMQNLTIDQLVNLRIHGID